MKNILIYNSGGGLGDSIQLIPLILSLQNFFKDSSFYYLGAHANHFDNDLKEFNIKLKNLKLDIKYFGFRWWHLLNVKKKFLNANCEKFNLIIDLQSKYRNSLILKKIPHEHFYSLTFNNFFSSKKIKYASKNHLENLSLFLNEKINKIEFTENKLPDALRSEAKRLLPEDNYIGFSITQGNEYRLKSWSISKFIELANKISLKGKAPVFFVKKNDISVVKMIQENVPTAIFPEHKSNNPCPALVTALSKRCELGITIDNGIMHMMGLAKIPLIILFGPTDSKKFAPNYQGVKILDSKKMYSSQNLENISVDDVLKCINF